MTTKTFAATILALSLLGAAGRAQSAASQSPADLLQRGIYMQETTGDIDGAIKIYRQVVESAGGNPGNNANAAQAQYRLVLCMLLKADPTAALRELQVLEQKFPSQQDLVNRARAILPTSATILPTPWGETEVSQLNIKRDGMFTGETLYYSVDPSNNTAAHQSVLKWELKTKNTTRSATLTVDSETLRPISRNGYSNPTLESNDDFGDAAADAFGGPAIDIQESVFAIRRMPLAVGYKTTLPTTSFTLGQKVPKQVELAVTGIEPVQVTSGKYTCYKVSISALGQTFWFGIDGARLLVKFQSGNVEADLVKVWGPGSGLDAAVAFLKTAGWNVDNRYMAGATGSGTFYSPQGSFMVNVRMTKVYTPASDIAEALRQVIPDEVKRGQGTDFKVRPDSIQYRTINGQQALSYISEATLNGPDKPKTTNFEVWIRTESTFIEFSLSPLNNTGSFAVARWWFEPLIETARIP